MSGAFGFQDAIVALIAIAAVAWLTRRWWRRRKRGTCTCDGCPVAEGTATPVTPTPSTTGAGLLTIEAPGSGFGTIEAPRGK